VSAYKNQLLKVNMKKMIRFLSVTAVLATAAAAAQAQVYVEGSVAALTAKSSSDGVNTETKPSAFSGLVGYNVHPNVDVEGYLGLGAGKSSITENGKNIGIDAKVKSSFGVFVKPKVMVSPEVEVVAWAFWKTNLKLALNLAMPAMSRHKAPSLLVLAPITTLTSALM
jgi:hypothetical protein